LNKYLSFFQNSVSFSKSSRKTVQTAGFTSKSKVAFSKAEVLKKPHFFFLRFLDDKNLFCYFVFFPVLNAFTFWRLLTLAAFLGTAGFMVVRFLFLLPDFGSFSFVFFTALPVCF